MVREMPSGKVHCECVRDSQSTPVAAMTASKPRTIRPDKKARGNFISNFKTASNGSENFHAQIVACAQNVTRFKT